MSWVIKEKSPAHLGCKTWDVVLVLQKNYNKKSIKMSKKSARLYSTVTIKSNNWQGKYKIVKPEEINIFEHKISSLSPLGQALLSHKVREVVEVKTPEGDKRYRILAIE